MRVGYIGLGDMGGPMAAHLAPAGFETTVFDLDTEAMDKLVESGAQRAASVLEVGQVSDVVCVCVQTDAQVRAVLVGNGDGAGEGDGQGALDGLKPGGVVMIHSTVSPDTIDRMHAAAIERGATVVDAAVTRGGGSVAAGEIVFMVGGDDEVVERIRPILEASSKLAIHAGPIGAGVKLKLAVNLLGYVHFAAVNEAFGLAEVMGIDADTLVEASRANGSLSDAEMAYVTMASLPQGESFPGMQDYLRTQLITAEKDLAHALEQARKGGLAIPTAALVSQNMARIYRVDDKRRR